jgi:hypothetical protein
MDLSVTHMFIWNNQFPGVMKTTIVKDFHDIKLRIDFYKILTTDRQFIDMVKKNCEEDHSNVDTMKLVSIDNIYSKMLNYIDSEEFIKYLRFILARNIQDDLAKGQRWIIDFKFNKDVNFFKVTLDSQQTLRLYNQVNSFYSNYLVFASMAKNMVLENESTTISTQTKPVVNKYVHEFETCESAPVVTPQELLARERNELDDIFELCLNTSIKSSLIHYTFNYFQYLTNKHCQVLVNDKNAVQYILPLLMPGKFVNNEQYFNSLILSNFSTPSNNIIYVIKKILQNLYVNHKKYQENVLYLMMMNYLLFIYLLRYLYDSNRDSFRIYFKQFMCVPYIQNRLLTSMIASGFPDFASKLYFKITNVDFAELNDEYNLEKIKNLSKDYKHLIPVSQQIFVDKIFAEINNTDETKKTPFNFKLSSKKVIDVVRLLDINQNKQKLNNLVLFDPDNTLNMIEDEDTEYNLLNYKLLSNNGSKVITNAYRKILDYIRNPSSILIMSENEIPKEIKNLFEIISKKILNSSRITKDMISTFSYYNILLENIPNPQIFKHTTFLYIIYQLIIPYHYDIYNNSQFEDVFL